MYVGYYVFGVGHTERHYLKNPRGRSYTTAVTREVAFAKRFTSCDEAYSAVEKFLARDGGHPDYHMIPCTEKVND